VSALTPVLTAVVQDPTVGATGVTRKVVDGLLALLDDPVRLRAAAGELAVRLAWCGPMWQVACAAAEPDPGTALRGLRQRLDCDTNATVEAAVAWLRQGERVVRVVPGSGLVDAVVARLPEHAGGVPVGLVGADAIGPDAVLNVAGTGQLAGTLPTVVLATSIKLVPVSWFQVLGGEGLETVALSAFSAVILDGQLLTPADVGRRAANTGMAGSTQL
jgi:hypothetical protein